MSGGEDVIESMKNDGCSKEYISAVQTMSKKDVEIKLSSVLAEYLMPLDDSFVASNSVTHLTLPLD